MNRLSIIIPFLGERVGESALTDALDETLVSVLENRPSHSEVLVACAPTYADPYDLDDEVRFIRVENASRWTTLANQALLQSRARFVNVLTPGITVTANWERDACDYLARCPDRVVGASPRLEYDADRSATAGVQLAPCGRRRYVDADRFDNVGGQPWLHSYGPCRQASFFRRAELILAGGWNEAIHEDVADVELALRLRSQQFDFSYRGESVVRSSLGKSTLVSRQAFQSACDLERVYRTYRNAGVLSRRGLGATLRHATGVMSDSFFGRLAGRFGRLPMVGISHENAVGRLPRTVDPTSRAA